MCKARHSKDMWVVLWLVTKWSNRYNSQNNALKRMSRNEGTITKPNNFSHKNIPDTKAAPYSFFAPPSSGLLFCLAEGRNPTIWSIRPRNWSSEDHHPPQSRSTLNVGLREMWLFQRKFLKRRTHGYVTKSWEKDWQRNNAQEWKNEED